MVAAEATATPPTASISSRHPLSIIIFLSRRRLVTVDVTAAAKTDYIEHTVYCKESVAAAARQWQQQQQQ